ncbi:MAG: hypothetical protein M3Q18_07005 [Actinomycetota bacterium]|nr:hypothetical protein [Actinomycetota bacterium]
MIGARTAEIRSLIHSLSVSLLVDDQTPVTILRRGCSEVLEVKGEDRQVMAFAISHDRGIDEAQIEIPIPFVYLGRARTKPCVM